MEWKKNFRPWSWFGREKQFRNQRRQPKVKKQNEIKRTTVVSATKLRASKRRENEMIGLKAA